VRAAGRSLNGSAHVISSSSVGGGSSAGTLAEVAAAEVAPLQEQL
jgi:hypothetical protein